MIRSDVRVGGASTENNSWQCIQSEHYLHLLWIEICKKTEKYSSVVYLEGKLVQKINDWWIRYEV